MYIRTSITDRNELSKILARELSKNFTNAKKGSEKFYVSSERDFEKIVKLYKLQATDSRSRLVGENQVLFFRSEGCLEVEGLRQFGSEPDLLKFLELCKNYFGSIEVVNRRFYRNYRTTSQKNLYKFADHLYKNFNISTDNSDSDLIGVFGNIVFFITKEPFSDQGSLRFKTNFFKSAK